MKHFIVEITFEQTPPDDILQQHRAHLKSGYEQGLLLMSGPQNPRTGGIVVARATDIVQLQLFFNADPYLISGVASYRYIEFNPVLHNEMIQDWI